MNYARREGSPEERSREEVPLFPETLSSTILAVDGKIAIFYFFTNGS